MDRNQIAFGFSTVELYDYIFALAKSTIIFCSVAVCLLALRRRYFHPLSKFPGPFWASTTSLYQCWVYVRGDEHLVHRKLHEEYGE